DSCRRVFACDVKWVCGASLVRQRGHPRCRGRLLSDIFWCLNSVQVLPAPTQADKQADQKKAETKHAQHARLGHGESIRVEIIERQPDAAVFRANEVKLYLVKTRIGGKIEGPWQ